MKWFPFLALGIFLLGACADEHAPANGNKPDTVVTVVTTDTIPEMRQVISKKPAASYLVPVNDPKLERTFGVNIYETPYTFRFLLDMHYEAMQVSDTLNIPNFGIWPQVRIKPGADQKSCIIGFLDKKSTFKEYKKLMIKGDNMKLVVLKHYFTGHYRTTYK